MRNQRSILKGKWFFLLFLLLGAPAAWSQLDTVLIANLKPVDGVQCLEGEPYSGEAYFLKSDGSPMVMRSYIEGVKEGQWKTWHSNGNLYKVGEIKDGLEHGEYREYFENGTPRYHYHYDLGKKTGKWLAWHNNGQLYTERNFENDILHGNLFYYDEHGVTQLSELYHRGKLAASDRFKVKGNGVRINQKVEKKKEQ